jgi:Ca-activated chloride channel homolog
VSFLAPVWLALLALVPLPVAAAVAAGRRRRRYAVRFTAFDTVAGVAAGLPRRRRHVPAALAALAACAMVLAVARPQVSVAVPVERAQIALVFDVSGSMNAEDVEPTRMEATKRAGERFVAEVPAGHRLGVVSFSSGATVLQSPTTEHDAVRAAIAGLSADGATATGDALATALEELREAGADGERPPSAVVLLSDGARTTGRDPLPVAREAGRLGIPVFTISLGTTEGVLVDPGRPWAPPQSVPPDPEAMREVARLSGGRAFTVEDAGRLDAIYEQLGAQLGSEQEDREVTAAFAGGALLLLLAALGLGLRTRGRLP